MQVELVDPATGQVFDTFEVEGANTDVGVGADLNTALGSFDVGDSGWDKSPMGKALREAAQKASKEIAKRGAMMKPVTPMSSRVIQGRSAPRELT